MTPEQLEGREADARTDIFAFGAVVYEMLTGKKAFAADTPASLIAAISKTIHRVCPPFSRWRGRLSITSFADAWRRIETSGGKLRVT